MTQLKEKVEVIESNKNDKKYIMSMTSNKLDNKFKGHLKNYIKQNTSTHKDFIQKIRSQPTLSRIPSVKLMNMLKQSSMKSIVDKKDSGADKNEAKINQILGKTPSETTTEEDISLERTETNKYRRKIYDKQMTSEDGVNIGDILRQDSENKIKFDTQITTDLEVKFKRNMNQKN